LAREGRYSPKSTLVIGGGSINLIGLNSSGIGCTLNYDFGTLRRVCSLGSSPHGCSETTGTIACAGIALIDSLYILEPIMLKWHPWEVTSQEILLSGDIG